MNVEELTTPVHVFAQMIRESMKRTRKKNVKEALQHLDFFEVSYKAISKLEQLFGQNPPLQTAGWRHKYWYAIKPMTNVAGSIGNDVLIGKLKDSDKVTKKNETRFKTGWHILTILFDLGILEIIRETKKKTRDDYKVRVCKGMEEVFSFLISMVDSLEVDISIYNKVQYTEPDPFTEFYHPVAGPMVRNTNPAAIPFFTQERMPKAFEAINKHMKVAYRINTDVLDVYSYCMEDDIFTFAKKELDNEQRTGMERERDSVLREAEKVGDRTFWELMFYDYRSRMYSASAYLSHAGSKLSKSLFLYDTEKALTSEGWFWLMIHASNCFGFDKASPDERYDFAVKNLPEWLEIGRDPVKNKQWQKADSPFEFLPVAMELFKAVDSGDKFAFKSRLGVSWDATCSGLQVLSVLARDEASGKLCNLTDTTERGDYYLMIANKVWEECDYTAYEYKLFERITADLTVLENKIKKSSRKGKKAFLLAIEEKKDYFKAHSAEIEVAAKVYWGRPEMYDLRRKVCKRPCMTYFYSCGERTMAKSMMKDHAADTEEFAGLTHYYCLWLSIRIFAACEELMDVPTSLMKLFIDLGIDDYKKKEDFIIDSPYTNFRMMQYYRKDQTKQIDVEYKGKTIKPRVAIAKKELFDRNKIYSATSPNMVHMLDSQIVAGILLKAEYEVSCIHDSFSTHAADAGKLFEDCRSVFVMLFTDDVLMDILRQKGAEDRYKEIRIGTLDLQGIIENEYNFL